MANLGLKNKFLLTDKTELLCIAHSLYMQASYNQEWIAMLIAWAFISQFEK